MIAAIYMAGVYVDRRRRLGSDSEGESTEESGYVDSGRTSVMSPCEDIEKAIGGNKFASFLTAGNSRKGKVSFGKPRKGSTKSKPGMYRKGLNPNAEEFVRTI